MADITSLNSQKEVVFNNLLNCIDYYNTVKGSFETSLTGDDPVTVAYKVDIPKQISYESVKGSDLDLEIFSHDGTITEVNKIKRNYHEERFIPQYEENTGKKQTTYIYEQVTLHLIMTMRIKISLRSVQEKTHQEKMNIFTDTI